jgi:hypothetical protein
MGTSDLGFPETAASGRIDISILTVRGTAVNPEP